MSSVASACSTSATSSSVMMPIRRSSSSTTGMASRLRSVSSRAATSWSAEARTRTVVGAMSSTTGVVARAEEQAVQGQDAEQVPLLVDDVDIVHRLRLVDQVADGGDRLLRRWRRGATATKAGVMMPPAESGG